ncbi:MAG: PRC-barrel domain containing protein [Spirochaetaceae bacterium]|nr:MAG: PRC-barrel domain containing protein [Spirochaetaceae bacterium]
MVHGIRKMHGFRLHATDDELGHVEDWYFDDEKWVVRYLVVKTGFWFLGKEVLISPHSVTAVDWEKRTVDVSLTRAQVEESPDIDTHQPISRRKEREFHLYYNVPAYWGGLGLWGHEMVPDGRPLEAEAAEQTGCEPEDEHLRSVREVIGYRLHAVDGDIAQVNDFLFEDQTWALRFLQAPLTGRGGGRALVIPPKLVDHVVWSRTQVAVNASREQLLSAPALEKGETTVDRDFETRLFTHYTTHPYWVSEEAERE